MYHYKVRRGDTLTDIAEYFSLTLDRLVDANPRIVNIDRIRVGQWVRIPEKGVDFDISAPEKTYEPITMHTLLHIVPTLSEGKAQEIALALNPAMEAGEINTPQRQAAFLAQIAHETGGFRWVRELGRTAYFKRYEGRADLGNTEPGDGARYKGRGFIQITGRYNYTQAGKALGINLIDNPILAERYDIAARLAVWYWNSRNLNTPADAGDELGFKVITRRINGGLNGYEDRLTYWSRAKEYLWK